MKSKMIIIEGPQGTGKSTLANYLRDNLAGSNLYRLSGQKDKTNTGKILSTKMYEALIEYLQVMQDIPMDIIFDRTFFTEEIYANLGYKDYSFHDVYEKLLLKLSKLNYEIYFINLYLENTLLYKERLNRVHHNYQDFSVLNSINQQKEYLLISNYIQEEYPHINVLNLKMDDFDIAYRQIDELFKLTRKKNDNPRI